MTNNLLAVSELVQIRKLRELIKPMLEPPGHLNTNWLKQNNWIAVPVESGSHFDDDDARLLAQAMQSAGFSSCLAVATELLEHFPPCFNVETTKEGLMVFGHECAHFNFVLTPASPSFAVLCTVFDYFVVSGSFAFVESALGCSLEAARARFLQFARDSHESQRLADVAARYE